MPRDYATLNITYEQREELYELFPNKSHINMLEVLLKYYTRKRQVKRQKFFGWDQFTDFLTANPDVDVIGLLDKEPRGIILIYWQKVD